MRTFETDIHLRSADVIRFIFIIDEIMCENCCFTAKTGATIYSSKSEYLVNNIRNFIKGTIETILDLARDRYFIHDVKIFPLNR